MSKRKIIPQETVERLRDAIFCIIVFRSGVITAKLLSEDATFPTNHGSLLSE